MVCPHPRDVILYARSSYYNDNVYLLRSCKTTLRGHYHVVLILTVEQERAIIDLFKQRQWKYVKA